ncbi:MAG: hypothetical protein CMJ86_04245 [Planctomycetes bacterium]|nr:hypothetical protein [Planctomycetota bacterium]
MKRLPKARLLSLLVCASLFACSNPQASEGVLVKTYGSVINAAPGTAWQATRTVFQELSGGQASFTSNPRLARMTYQGADVTVECVLHSSGGSVLRVSSQRQGQEARAVGDAVLLKIQSALLARR